MSFIEHLRDWMNRYYKLLLLLALVLALSMRLVNLNQPSLTDNEAQLALQAFGVVKGQSTNIGGQPGYVALTSLLFFIFGSSNFFARLWPALFGAGLVLVPCLFRKHMDDEVGVLLAFIIALEPGLIALSRTADGAMITITALLTAIGFLFNKKIVPSGILFAVSMAGSEKFWPLVLALGITGLVTSFKKEDKKPVIQKKENPRWQELGITFLITLLLIDRYLHGYYHLVRNACYYLLDCMYPTCSNCDNMDFRKDPILVHKCLDWLSPGLLSLSRKDALYLRPPFLQDRLPISIHLLLRHHWHQSSLPRLSLIV